MKRGTHEPDPEYHKSSGSGFCNSESGYLIYSKNTSMRFVSIYSTGPDNSLKIKKLNNKRANIFKRNHDKFYSVITKYSISSFLSLESIFIFPFFIYWVLFISQKETFKLCVCVYVSMCLCLVYSSTFW